MRARARHSNSDQQQQNSQNGETRQALARGLVVLKAGDVCGVHADELEEEVAEGDKVDDDDYDHADDGFATHPVCGEEEQEEGYDERGGCKGTLGDGGFVDDDEELHGEGEEEEEVEF
jgi:hypothetical protein